MKDWLLVATFQLLALLPLRVLRLIGRLIGRALWWLGSDARFVTETNLRLCYPEMLPAERERLARDSLQHLGMTALEVTQAWHRPAQHCLNQILSVEGAELFEDAKKAQKGVILLGPHMGNWEAFGVYLGAHSNITCMFQPPENPALNNMIYNARLASGTQLTPTNVSGVKTLLKTLKKGHVAGVLPDQVPPVGSGEFSPIFGIPALTMTMVYNLAQRTGAQVIFGIALREGSGYRVVFQAPCETIYSDDMAESLAALNKGVEQIVAMAPAQYQWEYKRFKKQPNGEKLYRKP